MQENFENYKKPSLENNIQEMDTQPQSLHSSIFLEACDNSSYFDGQKHYTKNVLDVSEYFPEMEDTHFNIQKPNNKKEYFTPLKLSSSQSYLPGLTRYQTPNYL